MSWPCAQNRDQKGSLFLGLVLTKHTLDLTELLFAEPIQIHLHQLGRYVGALPMISKVVGSEGQNGRCLRIDVSDLHPFFLALTPCPHGDALGVRKPHSLPRLPMNQDLLDIREIQLSGLVDLALPMLRLGVLGLLACLRVPILLEDLALDLALILLVLPNFGPLFLLGLANGLLPSLAFLAFLAELRFHGLHGCLLDSLVLIVLDNALLSTVLCHIHNLIDVKRYNLNIIVPGHTAL